MTQAEFAAAKVNLSLHVTGRRSDGYHLLDSLVCFADVGDRVRATPSADLTLAITGAEAAGLTAGPDNLVLRAARAMGQGAALVLDKRLPQASGIGGGSADAAATLRLLARMTGAPLPDPAAVLRLGADVPVCLAGRVCRMQGVGERLAPAPPLPPVWAVLANPRVAVPTPQVFAALQSRDNPPMPDRLPPWPDARALAAWLAATARNDLEPAAIATAPAIGATLAALAALPGALLARMSGSGATCLALFAVADAAQAAAADLARLHPGWWVAAARLGDAPATALQP